MNRSIIFGAFFGGTAVALGAVGSHLIKPQLPAESFSFYRTAILYQFIHALLLILIGNLFSNNPSRLLNTASISAILGILFFSGNIYLNTYFSLNDIVRPAWLGPVTPIGGLLFISSWSLILINEIIAARKVEYCQK